jgi:hypothetical protein
LGRVGGVARRVRVLQTDRSYADWEAHLQHRATCGRQRGLADIVNALIGAGRRVEFLPEFPARMFKSACMTQSPDGWRRPKGHDDRLPLLFSIRRANE